MKRDLTKRYSFLFEKRGVKELIPFIKDLYTSGKLREMSSFLIWEFLHRFGLFPKDSYLQFNTGEPIKLQKEQLVNTDLSNKLNDYFTHHKLCISPLAFNWKIICFGKNGNIFGCIYPEDRDLYKSEDHGKTITLLAHFPEKIKSLFISSQDTIFVCIKGSVYRGVDHEGFFKKAFDFECSESFFRSMYAITETPGQDIIIGEYGNVWEENGWKNLANLYFSSDNGETWKRSDFLKRKGINKHVHIIQYSRLLHRLLLADGDNKKKLWLSDPIESFDFERPQWSSATRFHFQTGGYTSMVESDGSLFFGTDYQGGTNFIVETVDGKKLFKHIVPDPYRRSPVIQLVQRKSRHGNEIWASLPFSTAGTKCLLMFSSDHGKSWNKVIEYIRSEHSVSFINSTNELNDELYLAITNKKTNNRLVFQITDICEQQTILENQ